ncbi:hypothetical protein KXW75_008551 [Aspergillus fumigatus]|nr:hypothetical protein KXX32_004186 [Aspergillus fumigatus]KAH2124438.1 hypothetical protein KXW75_008551 [Aspergillus fumigatus]
MKDILTLIYLAAERRIILNLKDFSALRGPGAARRGLVYIRQPDPGESRQHAPAEFVSDKNPLGFDIHGTFVRGPGEFAAVSVVRIVVVRPEISAKGVASRVQQFNRSVGVAALVEALSSMTQKPFVHTMMALNGHCSAIHSLETEFKQLARRHLSSSQSPRLHSLTVI